jgi:nucleoid-associated protein EbfC
MFGNMMGQMQEMQGRLKEKLRSIEVEATAGEGAVRVKMNAARELLNVHLDTDRLNITDKEHIEDLLVVAINRALAEAEAKGAAEGQQMIQGMLPPGLGNLFGM